MRTPSDPAARVNRLERDMRVLREDFNVLRNTNNRLRREVEDRDHSILLLSRQIEGINYLLESTSNHVTQLIRRPAGIPRPSATQTQGVNHG